MEGEAALDMAVTGLAFQGSRHPEILCGSGCCSEPPARDTGHFGLLLAQLRRGTAVAAGGCRQEHRGRAEMSLRAQWPLGRTVTALKTLSDLLPHPGIASVLLLGKSAPSLFSTLQAPSG